MKNMGRKWLEKYYYVDISCDGELWFSKEEDKNEFQNHINIDYIDKKVSFYKQKGFEFKRWEPDYETIIAVFNRIMELTKENKNETI